VDVAVRVAPTCPPLAQGPLGTGRADVTPRKGEHGARPETPLGLHRVEVADYAVDDVLFDREVIKVQVGHLRRCPSEDFYAASGEALYISIPELDILADHARIRTGIGLAAYGERLPLGHGLVGIEPGR